MAKDLKNSINIKANFQLDTSQARYQLSNLQKEIGSLTRGNTMDLGISAQLDQAVKSAQLLKQTLREATDFQTGALDFTKFNTALQQQGKQLADFRKELSTLGPEGEKVFNSLATTVASAQVPLKRTSAGFQSLLNTFGNTLRWQATSMAIHKVVGTISEAYNYAQNLDKSLNKIQIVTGHNAEYMRNFAREANAAASALSASTLEYTNASLIYYQQGLGDREVQKRAETTLKLAKVTGESASKISQEMTAIWNNFSSGVDNLERYADVMTALGATTASSSGEIARGLEKFAAISKTIGLSYDYAATALATVTAQTRQSADTVGTSFKTLFSRLESLNLGDTLEDGVTLNKYSQALAKVGVNALDVNGQLKDMDTILNELGSRWENLTNAQQVALAQTVGGVRNYTQLIALMDNWESFQTNLTTAQMAEGTLQKQADIYAESWEASQQRVKTAAQGIYDTLLSSDFFKGLNNLTAGLLNFTNGVGKTLGTAGSLSGLSFLFKQFYGEKLATGIDNTVNNLFSQTAFGQRYYRAQQMASITDLQKELIDTGSWSAGQRKMVLDTLSDQWKGFNPKNYATKAEAQAQKSYLDTRTNQALAIMNNVVTTDQAVVQNQLNQNRFLEYMGARNIDMRTLAGDLNNLTGFETGVNLGFRDYLAQAFEKDLLTLQGYTETGGQGSNPEYNKAIIERLQTTAQSILGEKKSGVLGSGEGSAKILALLTGSNKTAEAGTILGTLKDIAQGGTGAFTPEKIKDYIANIQEYGRVAESYVKKYSEDLDTEFLKKNPNIKEDSTEWKNYQTERNTRLSEMRAALGLEYKTESDITRFANKNALQAMQEVTKEQTVTLGQATVQTGQMLNSVTMAASSIRNFSNQVKDGTATVESFTSVAGSSVLAFSQMSSVLTNESKILGGALTVGKAGWIGLAAAAAIGIGYTGYRYVAANSDKERAERANENKIAATATAKERQQQYEQFLPAIANYQSSIDKLNQFQKGTKEYTSQLISANNEARALIEAYELKAGVDYGVTNGVINFSDQQIRAIDKTLQERSIQAGVYSQLSSSLYTQLSGISQGKEAEKEKQRLETRTQALQQQGKISDYEGYATDELSAAQIKSVQTQSSIQEQIRINQLQIQQKQSELELQEQSRLLEQQADYEVTLSTMLSGFENVTDAQKLAVIQMGQSSASLSDYQKEIDRITDAHTSLTRTDFGKLKSEDELRAAYRATFGYDASTSATQQSMAQEIENHQLFEWFETQINQVADKLGEGEYVSKFANTRSMRYSELQALIKEVTEAGEYDTYKTFIEQANKQYLNATAELVNNLHQSTNMQDILLEDLLDQVTAKDLTNTEIESLSNIVSSYTHNIGENAAEWIYNQFLGQGAQEQGINKNLLSIVQGINLDNSISALSDISTQLRFNKNTDLTKALKNLQGTINQDIKERGGLAKTLFTSSEFQNVFESLQSTFMQTGSITAENVADLAKKSDILTAYLQSEGASLQGVADMASLLTSGGISINDLTPSVASFINQASGGYGGMQQEALKTVANQNLSESFSNVDKYYQNGGKALYTAIQNNMLNDAPVREFLSSFLKPEDYDKYSNIIARGQDKDTSWMMARFKEEMPSAYKALNAFMGTGKKRGKGGGGLSEALEYYGADENTFKDAGITIGNDGKINFNEDFGPAFDQWAKDNGIDNLQTEENVQKFLKDYLVNNQGFAPENAEILATQMTGKVAASSLGTTFRANGFVAGTNELLANLDESGFVSSDVIKALSDKYKDAYNYLYKDKGGNIRAYTQEEINAGKNKEGHLTEDKWRQYLISNGLKMADINSIDYTNGISAEQLGNQLQSTSEGSIRNSGIGAILEVAQARGYGPNENGEWDYEKLQEYYTNVLQAPQEVFEQQLNDIINSGQLGPNGVSYTYTDIFGNPQQISSAGKTPEEFQQEVKDQQQFNDKITERLESEWIDRAIGELTEAEQALTPENILQKVKEYRQQAEDDAKNAADNLNTEETTSPTASTTTETTTPIDQEWYGSLKDASQLSKDIAEHGILGDAFSESIADFKDTLTPFEKLSFNLEKFSFNQSSMGSRIEQIDDILNKDPSKLTPFETFVKSILQNIDENVDTQTSIAEDTEKDETNKTGGRKGPNGEEEEPESEPEEPYVPPSEEPESDVGGGINWTGGGPKSQKSLADRINDAFRKGDENAPEGTKVTSVTIDGVQYTRDDIVDQEASGQNNNLLRFAKGKEGHIAITGELGPELRIKSNGSADLLGQNGRQYAWVEPDDKIYTAAQTQSILSNNNIESLQKLATGLNNYLPTYGGGYHLSSSYWGGSAHTPATSATGATLVNGSTDEGKKGSGGGYGGYAGGGEEEKKDPRYDPNTLKIRDVLERYYTILQKIDDITRAVERFSKVADRAWGKDRIKAIEKQTELYKQQYDAQKKYVSEIGEYLNTDESALTTMIKEFVDSYNEGKEDKDKLSWAGAEFDSNGVLTNYREFVEKLVEKYNENAEENAKDKEAQYKFQEQLKDIQFYTETLNTYESETDKLIDLANQIIDSSLKEITYRVEYELELNNDLERVLNFKSDLVKDNVFKTAEYLALLDEEMQVTADNLSVIQEGVYDYLGTLAGDNLRNGKTYTTNDLGITKRVNGINEDINYDDIDFEQVTKNLDDWLEELHEKTKDEKGNSAIADEVREIIQRDTNGLITNYREVFDKINAMNQKLSQKSIELLQTDVQEFFNQLSSIKDNPMWSGLTTEQKDQLTNYMEQTITELNKLRDQFKDTIESLGDSLKDMNKKIGSEIDEFGYYGDVYQNFLGIINLTNRYMTDISSDFFKNLNSKIFDNNINKIKATNTNLKLQANNLAEVNALYENMITKRNAANAAGDTQMADFYQEQADLLKDQLDIANKAYEDATKDFQAAWKDALEGAKTAYEDTVKEASRAFEESFSPFFNTLALLEAQFGREKQLADLYVDDYQRIHDLSKLNRDIENSILDTDNLKSKERLRELQKEINDLQDSGVELSEYDLDILDKKYKLELARQALEDARDAKSLVRLSRDNNGNWGYIYTSNEDEVAEAEQNYEDAIREMEEANEQYIDNIQDQIIQVQKEAQEAIANLSPDDFATYDEYLAAVQNITNAMMQNMNYLRQQLNNAFGNNEYLDPYIVNRYGINDHNLTDDFQDTVLSGILGVNNMDQVVQDALNRINDLATASSQAFVELQQNQEQIYEAAEHNINLIGAQMGAETEVIADASAHQVQVVEDLSERIADAFSSTANIVEDELKDWADEVKSLTDEYTLLLEVITELKRLDGEYVEPTKMINADNAIDSWKEISDFKKNLAANGVMSLLTTNDEGIEFADTYIAGSTAANNFIKGAMESAARKDGVFDFEKTEDPIGEFDKLKAYLKKRGVAVFKWKDEEHIVWSEEDEWFKKLAEHIEELKNQPQLAASLGFPSLPVGWFLGPINAAHPNGVYNPGNTSSSDYQNIANANGVTKGYVQQQMGGLSGMYTGEWSEGSTTRGGRLAWLHQKELVLNAHDTENFLDAMEIVRQLDNLTNWMANGLGDLFVPNVNSENSELEQNVHIEASFPNVTNHNEIEMAFDNLVNRASQYANRK